MPRGEILRPGISNGNPEHKFCGQNDEFRPLYKAFFGETTNWAFYEPRLSNLDTELFT